MPSKPNILLINPWIYDFTAYDFWLKPMGLLQIAAVLNSSIPAHLTLIDCLDRRHPGLNGYAKNKKDGRGPYHKEEVSKPTALLSIPRKYSRYGIPIPVFEEELKQIPKPDAVLISCTMTYWYPGVKLAIELLRKRFGRVPVILGGIYATLMPEHAARETGADVICSGPGESKIIPVLRDVLGNGACKQTLQSYDKKVPKPSWQLLRDKNSLALLTSRGCPFSCTYCAGPKLYQEFKQYPPAQTAAQIKNLATRYKTRNFAFYDDALLLNKQQYIIPMLQELAAINLNLAFHTPNGLHTREIDDELALLFKKTGFKSLFLSQEGFDAGLLKRSSGKVSTYDLSNALDALENAGYRRSDINVYLLVGHPQQNFSITKANILQARRLGAVPRLAYYSPVPGTPDWEKITSQGLIKNDSDPLLHNKLVFPYLLSDMTRREFEQLQTF